MTSGDGRAVLAAGTVEPGTGRMRASILGSLAGKAAELVTLLLLATVVPRALGPDAYGRFSVPLTAVTLGSLALTLGGPTLMTRYVPSVPVDQRLALARAIGARLLRGRAVQVTVLAAAAATAAVLAPDAFPATVTFLVVCALAVNVGTTLALQVGLGLGRTGAWSVRYPLQNAVLIVSVLVLHPWAGDTGGAAAILLAAVASAAFAAAVTWPVLRCPVDRVPVPAGAIRFGAFQATGAAFVQFSHRGPVLAVALLAASDTETGYASLATGIALGVTYAVLQTFTVSLPHLAAAGAGADPEAVLRRLAGGLLALAVPAVTAVAVTLDDLVPMVFGDAYGGAADAFRPALALVVLAPVNALAVQAAALRFRPEVAALAGAVAAISFVAVAVVAVPAWGAAGGTTAALVGGAASALVSAHRLRGAIGPVLLTASFAGAAVALAAGVA